MLNKMILAAFVLLFVSCNNASTSTEGSDYDTAYATPDTTNVANFDPQVYEMYATFEEAEGKVLTGTIPEYEVSNEDQKLPSLITDEDPACAPFPKTIAELNSGSDMFITKYNTDLMAAAKAMGYSAEIGKRDILFIQDYVRYTDCGENTRVGIGLRCYIHVKNIKGRLSLDKISQVGAMVEAGKAKADFKLKSLGFAIDGSVLVEGLQNQGEYNSEVAGKLTQVYNNVLKLLNASNPMPVRPVKLPKI